jgi:CARDB
MWKRIAAAAAVFAVLCGAAPARAQRTAPCGRLSARAAQPELRVEQFLFPPTNDKALRVRVVNGGGAASGLCVLRLTVRKINDVAVGRVTEIKFQPLGAGKERWVVVDAKSILPVNVALTATTFKLNVDATEVVAESDESNNEAWHNL